MGGSYEATQAEEDGWQQTQEPAITGAERGMNQNGRWYGWQHHDESPKKKWWCLASP